jgi:hypothetical protein
MIGMEKMLASMLGVSPDQMGAMATQITGSLLQTAEKINEMDRKLNLIMEALNVNGSDSGGNPIGAGDNRGGSPILLDGATGRVVAE